METTVAGATAVDILSGYGIDVGLIQTVPDVATGTVSVELDGNGKPTFEIHEDSAWDHISWNDEIASRVASADAVCFGTLGQRGETSRQHNSSCDRDRCCRRRTPRVVDINLRPPFFDAEMIRDSVKLASTLKLSDDELGEVCSACGIAEADNLIALRRMLDFGGLDQIVMTRGAERGRPGDC